MTLVFSIKGHEVIVDAEDGHLLSKGSWRILKPKGKLYVCRADGVYLHHLILARGTAEDIDHRDGDGLNNTRGNLRRSTHQQNQANVKRHVDGSSQYKGVTKRRSRWIAQCSVSGKNAYLGTFDSEEAAARAYDEIAKKSFGEFARLNFP
jgi:hypothetical protein